MIVAIVGGIALCWILLTPPGAGADEPGHLVRAGALARGHLDPDAVSADGSATFDLPASYALPDPACYAFHPAIPAGCAAEPAGHRRRWHCARRPTSTRSGDTCPAGCSAAFRDCSRSGGRASAAQAVPAALVGAAALVGVAPTTTRHGRHPPAVTPTAWGVFAVVNPSAMAIGGAVALWAGLFYASVPPSSAMAWLTVCGWAASALPRRDGLIWACIALAIALGRAGRTFTQWWRGLGVGPQVVVAGSTLVTAAWGITNDSPVPARHAVAAHPRCGRVGEVVVA